MFGYLVCWYVMDNNASNSIYAYYNSIDNTLDEITKRKVDILRKHTPQLPHGNADMAVWYYWMHHRGKDAANAILVEEVFQPLPQ